MISATIITLNEQEKIGKALGSLKGLAQEVIVVDSGSDDSTLSICKDFKVQIFIRKFDNFANQKNYALSKTKGDWIISLDADEEISPALANEIREAIKSSEYAAYLIPRRNFILGAEIKYSRWSPDRHIWLWKKNSGKWVGGVHEEVVVSGKIGKLVHSKIHNSHKTLNEFIETNNLYSSLEAENWIKNNKKFSAWNMFSDALLEFFLRFLYKKGFLDGSKGFALAYMMGIYKLTVWIKLWELERRK